MEGQARPSGPRHRREGHAPGGRYLPLPFVQLWRHAPSKYVSALLLSTQRLIVCPCDACPPAFSVGLLVAGRADLHTDCQREDVCAALAHEPHKFWLLTHLAPERTFIQRLSDALSGLLVKRSSANLADPLLHIHTPPPPFARSVRDSYSIAQSILSTLRSRGSSISCCVCCCLFCKSPIAAHAAR